MMCENSYILPVYRLISMWLVSSSSIKPYFTDAYIRVSQILLGPALRDFIQYSGFQRKVLPEFACSSQWFCPISTSITSVCRGSVDVVCKSHQWIWSIGQQEVTWWAVLAPLSHHICMHRTWCPPLIPKYLMIIFSFSGFSHCRRGSTAYIFSGEWSICHHQNHQQKVRLTARELCEYFCSFH